MLIGHQPLTPTMAEAVMGRFGSGGAVTVVPIKRQNDVYRLSTSADDVMYLKTYTKAWYGGDVAATGGCVAHEVAAWRCLAAAGLATPEIIAAEYGTSNPLGRPYLVTRALPGQAVTDALMATGDIHGLMSAIGGYLRTMHALTFAYPGYIVGTGPSAPPQVNAWQHRCWTASARQTAALNLLATESRHLSTALRCHLDHDFRSIASQLAATYTPPRFVHGDCHAHQFFVASLAGCWRVTGVVDMEVASAGDVVEDLLKLGVALATCLPAHSRWWEPLFAAYGETPDFASYKLRLLAMSPAEFADTDGGQWAARVRRVYSTTDYAALFSTIPHANAA